MSDSIPLEVDPEALQQLLADEAVDFTLVDCRERDEWELCRIERAQLIPLSQFGELSATALPDTGKSIIIYCHHGMRSANAAHYLRSRGYPNAFSLRGGIDLWSDTIDPAIPRY